MKYLIAGLGNIGSEYAETRHNIGFKVLDALAAASNAVFRTERYGDVAEMRFKGRTFLLLKPSTYMNNSGNAVRYWLRKEKVEPAELLVVLDDLALPLGTIRMRAKGNDGGHNGLKSIDACIGTNAYPRLRCGIGRDSRWIMCSASGFRRRRRRCAASSGWRRRPSCRSEPRGWSVP